MKSIVNILFIAVLSFLCVQVSAQLKVKNSNGKVTIGSTNDADEILEVYGDAQIFGESPYIRFKADQTPAGGVEGGLHWRGSTGLTNMRLYYDWNTNSLIIGPNDDASSGHIVIDNFNGFIGIGTENPSKELDVRGDIAVSGQIIGVSDVRTKMDVNEVSSVLHKIMKLNPVSYLYKTHEYAELELSSEKQYGFIAQEVEHIFPDLVSDYVIRPDSGESLKGIDYIKLIPLLTKAIQEQQILIDLLIQNLPGNQSLNK